ncbi:MAG: hypothetical protein ABIT16_03800 [Croceibacterium sp.]
MKSKISWLVIASSLAVVAACSSQKKEPAAPAALTFHEVMKDKVDVNADALWDVSNSAIGENAGIDASKMTDESWAQIQQRATAVQQAALEIAKMDPIILAKPGVKIADEGVPGGDTAAGVQQNIDKDPQKLRDFANTLASHMGDLAAAAMAHDAAKAGPLVDQLDSVCEDCHLEFWYPGQRDLLEQYGIKR